MGPWQQGAFDPAGSVMELRYLLGFVMKPADDRFDTPAKGQDPLKFYQERMVRFQKWTDTAEQLVARCLSATPDDVEVNFLYQDLPFAARQQARAELDMLSMMSQLANGLEESGVDPEQVLAVAGPDEDGDADALALRVNLYGPGEALLASVTRPIDLDSDLISDLADLADALDTMGVTRLYQADGFDEQGKPVNQRKFDPDGDE
jgi:hypothetical protein